MTQPILFPRNVEKVLSTTPVFVSQITLAGVLVIRIGNELWVRNKKDAQSVPDSTLPVSYRVAGDSEWDRFTRRPGTSYFQPETECRLCESWYHYSNVSDETGLCTACQDEI